MFRPLCLRLELTEVFKCSGQYYSQELLACVSQPDIGVIIVLSQLING